MKQINIYKNVLKFNVNINNLAIVDDERLTIYELGRDVFISEINFVESIYYWCNSYILVDKNNKIIKQYPIDNVGKEYDKYNIKGVFNNENYLCLYLKKPLYINCLLNTSGQLTCTNSRIIDLYNTSVYCFDNGNLESYEIGQASLNKKWELKLGGNYNYIREDSGYKYIVEPSVYKIIGEYLNIVWLVLSSGRLLGLDVITGKEIYNMIYPVNIPDELSADKGNEINIYNFKTEIDVENGQLFGLMHKYYWEIDLDNPMETFIYYDISESIKKYGLYPDRSALICKRNIIYFYQGGENNLIGLFDKNKRQIVHSFAIPNANWFTKIEYVSNKLYVLDGKNTLYVFENEDEKL